MSLSERLAVLEEESSLLRQKAAWATTRALDIDEKMKSELVRVERELAQSQADRIKEQEVAARQLKEEKAYEKIV